MMNWSHLKNHAIHLYILSMPFHTLFNYSGKFPISLFISLFIFLILFIKLCQNRFIKINISLIDFFMICYLFISFTSFYLNSIQYSSLNINHLFAHFSVFILYYFNIRWAIRNSVYNLFPEKLLNLLFSLLILTFTIIFFDYILLSNGINLANYLPMEQANKIAGVGVFSRPRGFFVEPTDAGLALNAIAPIVLSYLLMLKKGKTFVGTLLLYITVSILIRSASAIVGLAISIIFVGLLSLLNHLLKVNKQLININYTFILYFIFISFFLGAFYSQFNDIINVFSVSVTNKVLFDKSDLSSTYRYEAWINTFSLFLNSPNLLIGRGTGFMSDNSDSSLSWFLSVLVENGILGLTTLLMIFVLSFRKIMKNKSNIKYGLAISLVSVFIHLFTQTGFYFPFLWLIVVLSQIDWSLFLKSENYKISRKLEFNS
jgi:hypothetical protein